MASNMQKLVKKRKRQQFKRRRGGYNPFSTETSNMETYIQPQLRQISAQRVKTHGGVDRSQIPKCYADYVNYRAHAKGLAWTDVRTEQTPEDWHWLYTMFGATKFVSDERAAALKLRKLIPDKTKPELYFAILKTSMQQVRVYFSPRKDLWWIMHIIGDTVSVSITYSSKERAMSVFNDKTVRWARAEQFTFNTPD